MELEFDCLPNPININDVLLTRVWHRKQMRTKDKHPLQSIIVSGLFFK